MKTTHHLFATFILGFGIVSTAMGQAEDYLYETNNGTITITGYAGPGGDVTIPSQINGLPVTSIGDGAFSYCTHLTSVTIPSSVTSIGSGAFDGCSGLTGVTIPDSVTSIGEKAFGRCSSLTAITVGPNNPGYSSVDGVLFNKNHTSLIQYPAGRAGSYAIPTGATTIGGAAFIGCTKLTNVIIPDGVTTIEDGYIFIMSDRWGAFSWCTSLTNITIPDSVTSIGIMAFAGCTALSSMVIPDSVTEIGNCTFYYCTNLTSITIPDSVTSMGLGVFQYCDYLTNVNIGSGLTYIESSFFSEYVRPFLGCARLMEITVDARNPSFSSIEGVLFDKKQSRLIACPIGKTGCYAVPQGVINIGAEAFWGTGITSITIPNTVAEVGYGAFKYCTSVMAVYFEGDAPLLDGSDRYWWTSPDKPVIYFLPGTMGWTNTYADRPTAQWLLPYPIILALTPNFDIQTNAFGFRISWATNAAVIVEGSTSLANPVWFPLSTNNIVEGWVDFRDGEWTSYPARFYRVRQW